MSAKTADSFDKLFLNKNSAAIAIALSSHCSAKIAQGQPLTFAEHTYDLLREFGRTVANDGFLAPFHEKLTEASFSTICGALVEVGAVRTEKLLREAWAIYTKGKSPIDAAELRAIPVRRFNDKEKVYRFSAIAQEVEGELAELAKGGRLWAVEYAKLHRNEFQPIAKGGT